jgi:TIR domain
MLSNEQEPKARLFFSYSRKDINFVERLSEALVWRGFEPLMDRSDIYAFEEWWGRIEGLIARSDVMIFVVSPDSIITSSVSLKEMKYALSINKHLVAVLYRRVDDDEIPRELQRLQWICFDDELRFEERVAELRNSLIINIDWIRMHTEIFDLASNWIRHGQSDDYLISGKRLSEAEAWIASQPPDAPRPSATHFEFLKAGRKAQARRWISSPALRPSPQPRGSRIFISYRRSDTRHIAGRIYDRLKTEISERDIFFDVGTMPIGVNFKQHIASTLEDTAVVVAVVGEKWVNRTWKWSRLLAFLGSSEDFVKSEIDLALDLGVPIIPVVVDNVTMPGKRELPKSMAEFASLHAASVRSGRDFDADMRLVLSRIHQWREQALVAKRQESA